LGPDGYRISAVVVQNRATPFASIAPFRKDEPL
jgi:hypothetical protein